MLVCVFWRDLLGCVSGDVAVEFSTHNCAVKFVSTQTFQAMMIVFFLFLLCHGFAAALLEPRLRTGSEKVCVSCALTFVLCIGFRTCL